jgi:hypothetical protein
VIPFESYSVWKKINIKSQIDRIIVTKQLQEIQLGFQGVGLKGNLTQQALRGTREAAMDWLYVGSFDK